MEPKIKGYLTIGSVALVTLVAAGGVVINSKYNPLFNPPEYVSINQFLPKEKKEEKTLTAEEINTITGDLNEKKENFVDTDTPGKPEIIVDEKVISMMPKVEEKVEKKDIDKEKNKEELPSEINLNVPFFPQAPDANWALPWKDACEESSVVLAYHFVVGDNITKEQFKKDILGLVDLQKELFGDYIDTTIKETAQMLEEFYDYDNYEIIENPTIEDLKRELAQGHPIIAPFAGKKLGNSFFTNGGPRYHMLVIVGYKDGFFITNDVGTSRGKDFAYSYDTIMESMHDFVETSKDITTGEKRVLVVK